MNEICVHDWVWYRNIQGFIAANDWEKVDEYICTNCQEIKEVTTGGRFTKDEQGKTHKEKTRETERTTKVVRK